jgi:hypothetical protein
VRTNEDELNGIHRARTYNTRSDDWTDANEEVMRCSGVVSSVMIKKLNGCESLLGLGLSPRLHVPQLGLLGRERERDAAISQLPHHRPAIQEDIFTLVTKHYEQHRNHGLE